MVTLRQDATMNVGTPGGALGGGTEWHPALPPSPAGFNFNCPLPRDSTNAGIGFLSSWTESRNRSESRLRSMSLAVSWGVSVGALAEISKRSQAIQGGPPKIVSGSTP